MYVEKDLADMVISPMHLLVLTMYVVRALKLSLQWDYHLIKDLVALVMRLMSNTNHCAPYTDSTIPIVSMLCFDAAILAGI